MYFLSKSWSIGSTPGVLVKWAGPGLSPPVVGGAEG